MDQHRFDDLTRALALGRSRRQILKGLVGAMAAGLTALRGGQTGALAARNQPVGAPCARAGECASRFCVDGVCCDSSCTGQCESCATGTCSPVSGAPVGNRPACPGSGDCAATCDGQNRTACVFPGADVTCGAPQCAGDAQVTYACAGNGTCHPTTTSCGPDAVCCAGSCCASGQECVEGTCQEVEVCRVLTESCSSADQCCQDELTNCEVIPQSGNDGAQCCRPRGGSCAERFLDCCGTDECIDGVCVAGCFGFGLECFVDDHCCSGHCLSGICRDDACLGAGSFCSTVDECCQDEATFCEDVPRCGAVGENRCCRPVGGSCSGTGANCDCCGSAVCLDGTCVTSCNESGLECFLDDDCCSGSCVNNVCQACRSAGAECQIDSECCSDLCSGGSCGPK
jgi:hypothetical protein